MPDLGFLLRVSRPRFWIYVFGPYLVGIACAAATRTEFLRLDAVIFALYFLFPANLVIYGVNDIFDFETDRLNPKKTAYEVLVLPSKRNGLTLTMIAVNLPFIAASWFLNSDAILPLLGFLFFSIFYSAPPIRAKTKPLLDSAFNILYVFPGIFAYLMISGEFPPTTVITAAGLWTMAMHAYSAVPDIESDRAAGLSTIATFLGKRTTLIFCLVMYAASAALVFEYLGIVSIILGLAYTAMIVISFVSTGREAIFTVYRYFPLLNAASGFIIFWFVSLSKLS